MHARATKGSAGSHGAAREHHGSDARVASLGMKAALGREARPQTCEDRCGCERQTRGATGESPREARCRAGGDALQDRHTGDERSCKWRRRVREDVQVPSVGGSTLFGAFWLSSTWSSSARNRAQKGMTLVMANGMRVALVFLKRAAGIKMQGWLVEKQVFVNNYEELLTRLRPGRYLCQAHRPCWCFGVLLSGLFSGLVVPFFLLALA